MKTFFTSDTHFGHANIIKYSGRPFQSAREMDDTLIANWNQVVGPNDLVYHLGDFSYGDEHFVADILAELNGNIVFNWGNHDKPLRRYKETYWRRDRDSRIDFVGGMAEIEVQAQQITLCHYAMRVWNKSHYGAWHLYGHSHGSLPDDPNSRSFDVGVDCHNYRPISFEEVDEIMMKKIFVPIDHHGGDRQKGGGIGLGKEEYAKAERHRQFLMLQKEFDVSARDSDKKI